MAFYETVFVRGLAIFLVDAFLCWKNGLSFDIPVKSDLKYCLLRSLAMAYQGWSVALSHFYIPIPVIHTLSGSGPIFVFAIDYYRNGVSINKKQLVGMIFGICGVILTVNGRILMSWIDPAFSIDSEFKNYKS